MHNEFLNGVTTVPDKKSVFRKTLQLSLTIITILFISSVSLFANDASPGKNESTDAMFGIAGTGGLFSAIHLRGKDEGEEPKWKPGYGFGGGFVFDYMFSESTGLHSGLYYYYAIVILEMNDSTGGTVDLDTAIQMIQMPLYFFYALNGDFISLDLMGGFHLSYMTHVEMSADGKESRAINLMGYQQPGFGAGLRFRFHITRFIDLYLGIMGEFYANDLIAANTDWTDYMYDGRGEIGLLFKTF